MCTHLLDGYPFLGLGTRERVGAPADQSSFFHTPALVDDLLGETVLQVGCTALMFALGLCVPVWGEIVSNQCAFVAGLSLWFLPIDFEIAGPLHLVCWPTIPNAQN